MKDLNEEILGAWLQLTTAINNERLVSDMPYNEALICYLLYNNQPDESSAALTATDLCRLTNMLKSQMNRTLQNMEDKGLIFKIRSESDKRQVYIFLNTDSEAYQKQHEKSIRLIETLVAKTGKTKAKEIAELFTMIANIAREVIK